MCALLVALLALLAAATNANSIAGQYIVTVKPGQDARGIARAVQANPQFVYSSALNGFAAQLHDGQLHALRNNPAVELVEQDAEVEASTTQLMDGAGDPWGLDRIDQFKLALSKTYTYAKSGTLPDGQVTRANVIDTGLQADHPEFGGRAANMFNSTATSATDCNGHGTHVAGTIGARTFGVAKTVYLRGVKVLDSTGHGSWSGVIAGVDWVKANAIKPAVANLSLGGAAIASVDKAAFRARGGDRRRDPDGDQDPQDDRHADRQGLRRRRGSEDARRAAGGGRAGREVRQGRQARRPAARGRDER